MFSAKKDRFSVIRLSDIFHVIRVHARTPDFSSCSAFFTDSGVDPVEACYSAAETCRERAKLTQVTHLFESDEIVCHALEVGIYPHDNVERICIFEEFP